MPIDLHIHSNYSDGTLSPEEIVEKAKQHNLVAISITDHDTTAAVPEAKKAGNSKGIEVVSGVELSALHQGQYLHILGYFFDYKNIYMAEKLNVLQEERAARNKKIVEKLQNLGISISYNEVEEISERGEAGRPHIGRLLVKKNIVRDLNEAFALYLKSGAKAYVSRFIYSSHDAIEMIREAGGVAVLAHPSQIDPTCNNLDQLIKELVELGIEGIEIYYPTHTKRIVKKLKQLAYKYNLAQTGGSDYHGHIRPGTDIAGGIHLNVPKESLYSLREKRKNIVVKG